MIHLTTTIGKNLSLIRFMLPHYQRLGIESFFIDVHQDEFDQSHLVQVDGCLKNLGVARDSLTIGPWSESEQVAQRRICSKQPEDWFVFADHDELQVYPDSLKNVVAYCDHKGYDYVMGCFVDRLALDGSLVAVQEHTALEEQFPLAGFVSFPISGGDPRKIVLAKGHVDLTRGQHRALSGKPCPPEELFIQVHHYKWVVGLLSYMTKRAWHFRQAGLSHWIESARVVSHLLKNEERINIQEPAFLLGAAVPTYERWGEVRQLALDFINFGVLPPVAY